MIIIKRIIAIMRAKIKAAAEPTSAETNKLIGMFNQKRYAEAESLVRAMLLRYPKSGFCHKALGAMLRQQGRIGEALAAMQQAAALLPADTEVHYNLAVILKEQGRLVDAEVNYKKVLARKPDFIAAYQGLGNLLKAQDRLDEAVACFRQALKIKPDSVESLDSLAQILVQQRAWSSGLELSIQYLRVSNHNNAKIFFVQCVTSANLAVVGEAVLHHFVLALTEPWAYPSTLMPTGVVLLKRDVALQKCIAQSVQAWPKRLAGQELFHDTSLAAVAGNVLLVELLVSAPVCNIELERFFTSVRNVLLNAAISADSKEVNKVVLNFYCALARQCFINEYVYALTDEEALQASDLRNALIAALENDADIPAILLIAVAAYFPLHTLSGSAQLLQRSWPEAIAAMLTQLVSEPIQERQFHATLPKLTAIEGVVSLAVQNMYEENPYPRWVKAAPAVRPASVNDYLRQNFPTVSFQPLNKDGDVEVLIAGCGTGRHSIGSARKFINAKVLAIDLSVTSLSYAKRKTQELGLTTIEYAQADIMKLAELKRSFDVIESGGVLHHLGDPLAGWRVLLSLLRPGGVMGIALYSEVARQDIVSTRAFIAEHHYASTAQDIRRCRQDLMDLDESVAFRAVLNRGDFYSMSDCRDLLFHVQEHRMTIPGIEAFLGENKLSFLGFQVKAKVLAAYNARFPNDPAAIDLSQWQIFEHENPDTFIGMYQFWLQKSL
ncbi:MAG: tetratricopeptide repeat protein [Gallionella sp.]|nr:tetratricopeptide repeat protein [Gallionella sp.]